MILNYSGKQWRSQYRGKGGQSAPLDSEKIVKNREKIGKKRGKIRKKREKKRGKSRKGGLKNREGSFTLPLLTNRAGYATAGKDLLVSVCNFPKGDVADSNRHQRLNEILIFYLHYIRKSAKFLQKISTMQYAHETCRNPMRSLLINAGVSYSIRLTEFTCKQHCWFPGCAGKNLKKSRRFDTTTSAS